MKSQLTGMTGVYFAAAELSRRSFVVAMTAGNAPATDLLATDQEGHHTWSFQVKTNELRRNSWRIGQDKIIPRPNYFFIFVTINRIGNPEYVIAHSGLVSVSMKGRGTDAAKGQTYINRGDLDEDFGLDKFVEHAFKNLTWEDARRIATKPKDHPTVLLSMARDILKPPKDNKLDRAHRKAIDDELDRRDAPRTS